MRILGLDWGARRIGVAISDEAAAFAFPHGTIPNDGTAERALLALVSEKKIGRIVMGDTRAESGASNSITAQAERFADSLAKKSGLSVELVPEYWSSREAARFSPTGPKKDESAAAVILQRHLDMNSGPLPEGGEDIE